MNWIAEWSDRNGRINGYALMRGDKRLGFIARVYEPPPADTMRPSRRSFRALDSRGAELYSGPDEAEAARILVAACEAPARPASAFN